jgi:predicted RNA-binding Zn-ribbon protein involved in translation (DUF1610 family)
MQVKKQLLACVVCHDDIIPGRAALGYRTCLWCGEEAARRETHCIVPMNKSNYVAVTDLAMLRQLNPKQTYA